MISIPFTMLLLVSAAVGQHSDADPLRIDLLQRCEPGGDGDIVVCGSRDQADRYRLRSLPDVDLVEGLPSASLTLPGGGTLAVEGEAASVGGFSSNRAMVRLRLPF